MNDPAIRRRFGRALTNVFMYSILIGISLFMMLPFFWMLSTSLKPAEEIFHIPPIIISMGGYNLAAGCARRGERVRYFLHAPVYFQHK